MLTGKWLKWVLIVVAVSLVLPTGGLAKKKKADETKSPYEFKVDLQLKSTPVKNQYWTGTCRCFATISFLESEALRLAKEDVDLSEMFVVRHTYPPKALKSGYTVVWDGDVSEKGFSSRKTGYAVVPEIDWEDQTTAQQEAKITEPVKEKEITQELRQKTFDNFTTTDDHLMHIVGLAHDQEGTKFYLTKNSNGTDRKNNGFVYLSSSYFRLKTTALTVHKESLPADLKSKLKLLCYF